MSNGGQRQKKRRRKEARSAQRKAWYVELRLLGYPEQRIKWVMGQGNHEDIRRAYEHTLKTHPVRDYRFVSAHEFANSPVFTKI